MGKEFGKLMKTRHVISYYLSPFEQKMFPSYSSIVLNTWRRFKSQVFRVAPPLVLGYLVYSWGSQEYERSKRKNPADYANDQ